MVNSGDQPSSLFRVRNKSGVCTTPEKGLLVYGHEGSEFIVEIIHVPLLNIGLNLRYWDCRAPRSTCRAFPFGVLLGHGHRFGLHRKPSPPSASPSSRTLPLLSSSFQKYYSPPLLILNRVISSRSTYIFRKEKSCIIKQSHYPWSNHTKRRRCRQNETNITTSKHYPDPLLLLT